MGQRKNRIKSRAKGLAPKMLTVRQQGAVKGGFSLGASNPTGISRPIVRQDAPGIP
jgi:hypothetical protein